MADNSDSNKVEKFEKGDSPQVEESSENPHDLVLIHGRTEDGEGICALRSRPGRLEPAILRPLKEGAPLHASEVVSLHRRKESPLLWDVQTQYGPEAQKKPAASSHAGPPRVTSSAYRQHWGEIFGEEKEPDSRLLN
jgi:hypothetical protein